MYGKEERDLSLGQKKRKARGSGDEMDVVTWLELRMLRACVVLSDHSAESANSEG